MSGARRRRAGIGDRVRVDGAPGVVISVTGTRVRLADEAGTVRMVTAAELASDPRFEIAGPVPARWPRPEIGLDGLPAAAVGEASWWEAHIAEVVYGLPPDAPAGTRPRPQYDPERRSLAGRPEGMFGSLPAAAPGEVVQIDSTPLDVLVLLDDGVPGRVELTGMIDVATRVVPAAVLRPTPGQSMRACCWPAP